MGNRWLRFTPTEMQQSDQASTPFSLEENGTVRLNQGPEEEMDFAAEHLAREMMQ